MSNPQAFPRPHSVDDVDGDLSYPAHAGMTLRDYFAAQVACNWCDFGRMADDEFFEAAAEAAYKMADAMLKVRDKHEQP